MSHFMEGSFVKEIHEENSIKLAGLMYVYGKVLSKLKNIGAHIFALI